jgi:glycosyltransferase involved in cell wall biosynthesis
MYKNNSIAVVVPAHNEELLIKKTIDGIPEFVDRIVVVNDNSSDSTGAILSELKSQSDRIILISHSENKGVGGSIASGYIWCRDYDFDVAVVMAGDAQMDPSDLPALLDPVVSNQCDYAKGNRLTSGEAWSTIPRARYLGNACLTFLTKIASGYWHVTDSQCGYTAINKKALKTIPLETIYPTYGVPNDILVTLNIYSLRVADLPVKPIYGIGEKSGFKCRNVIFSLSKLMTKLFFKRMFWKYVVRDFHPLVLFYSFGLILMLLNIPLFVRMIWVWGMIGEIPKVNFILFAMNSIMAFQSILFAMLFDMEANKHLKGVIFHGENK